MRTTLTIDEDVAVRLLRLQREREMGLKEVVNAALRAGLPGLEHPPKRSRRRVTAPRDLGRCLIGAIVSVSDALDIAESDARK